MDISGYLARNSIGLESFSDRISDRHLDRSNGFNTSFETDVHLRPGQVLAAQAEEIGAIQLDEYNTVRGLLKCGMKFDIVVDLNDPN